MKFISCLSALAAAACLSGTALAHVPYIEGADYSPRSPLVITRVENSKAIYGWLASAADVDYSQIDVTSPVTLQADVLVQVCPALAEFLPSYAIIGPGLPAPTQPIPVPLPDGYGAIVVPNLAPGTERPTFFEPAGGKTYYEGVETIIEATTPGRWAIIVWDPYRMGGDYVLSVGFLEKTSPSDLRLTARNLPIIRSNGELHTPCPDN
jgi:hypothetical protein